MKAKYSKVIKRNGKQFRYDYTGAYLQWVGDLGEGLEVIEEIGLRRENWENKASRNEYIDGWCDELEEELAYLSDEVIEEFERSIS